MVRDNVSLQSQVFLLMFPHLPGPQQGHSNSQRRCRGNAGQLRPGLLAHEVLHRTLERLQKRGLGIRQQQAGPAEGLVPAGDGRGHRLRSPYLNRCVKMVFVKTLKFGHCERRIISLPRLNLAGLLVWCVPSLARLESTACFALCPL